MSSAISAITTAQLYARYFDVVRRALARLGTRSSELDDLAQEVFLLLHRKACHFESEGAARAWLFATARRVASNARRSRMRAEARLEHAPAPSPAPCPERTVRQREAAASLHQFMADLPAEVSTIFHLSEVEGIAAPEVAKRLSLKLNTTYSHIRRARKRFARAFAIGLGLVLLVLAALAGTCAAEATDERPRLALRAGPHPHG
jgi:RNA polymerase sigma-70 factor, ECF subfamily